MSLKVCSSSEYSVKTIMLIIILFLTFITPVYKSYSISSNNPVVVSIDSNGLASIYINVTVVKGLNRFNLPIEPIPETIVVKIGSERITPIYYNNTLIIPSDREGLAYVTYTANVSVVGGRITLKIGSSQVLLRAANNIVLLSLPDNIEETYVENNLLVIKFMGPAEISYTLAKVSAQPTGKIVSPPPNIPWLYVGGGILAIVIVLSIAYIARRKPKGLDSTDKAIIDYLKKRGGQALQSEIMGELKIPKTTLWRHVKRLEKYGYVDIEQVGRVNIVKLRK